MKWVLAVVVLLLAGISTVLLLPERRPSQESASAPSASAEVPERKAEEPSGLAPSPVSAAEADVEYLRRVRTADIRRTLHDPDLPRSVSDFLLDQGLPATVRSLEELARLGDTNANVSLLRLQMYCDNRDPLVIQRGAIVATRTIASRREPPPYFQGCSARLVDPEAIEARLRQAAEAGHTQSLLMLGHLSDEGARRKHWTSAAILGDPQAQLALSALLRQDSAGGLIPPRAAFWLNVAAKNSLPARTAWALCRAEGCDGNPADAAAALEQLRSAARQGDEEALELLAEQTPSLTLDVNPDERYAWLTFLRDLWRYGCYGPMEPSSDVFSPDDLVRNAERRFSPYALKSARELAASYWSAHSADAMRAQRCN